VDKKPRIVQREKRDILRVNVTEKKRGDGPASQGKQGRMKYRGRISAEKRLKLLPRKKRDLAGSKRKQRGGGARRGGLKMWKGAAGRTAILSNLNGALFSRRK